MSFFFQTLYSGSEGNSCLVGCNGDYILIDAGKNSKAVLNALSSLSLSIRDISAIFVTHEHSDHIGAIEVLARRYKIPVFANPETAFLMASKQLSLPETSIYRLENYDTAKKGALRVTPFPVPHDSVSCSGYIIEAEGKRLVTATDMGHLCGDFAQAAKDADAVLIESNYDLKMLENGSYPAYLKKRISSKNGHLSNADCAEACSVLAMRKTKKFVLAHLSKENNTPESAFNASHGALTKKGASVTKSEEEKGDVLLLTAPRYVCSPKIII